MQLQYAQALAKILEENKVVDSISSNLSEQECYTAINTINSVLLMAQKKILKDYKTLKNVKKDDKHKKSKRWWCTTLTKLIKSRSYIHRKHKETKLPFYSVLVKKISKKFKKIARKRKRYFSWLERQELIEKYLKSPNVFWREVNKRKGAKIGIDIDINTLKENYMRNFNSLSQSSSSINI